MPNFEYGDAVEFQSLWDSQLTQGYVAKPLGEGDTYDQSWVYIYIEGADEFRDECRADLRRGENISLRAYCEDSYNYQVPLRLQEGVPNALV